MATRLSITEIERRGATRLSVDDVEHLPSSGRLSIDDVEALSGPEYLETEFDLPPDRPTGQLLRPSRAVTPQADAPNRFGMDQESTPRPPDLTEYRERAATLMQRYMPGNVGGESGLDVPGDRPTGQLLRPSRAIEPQRADRNTALGRGTKQGATAFAASAAAFMGGDVDAASAYIADIQRRLAKQPQPK
ncbi:MAG: hypothetical protein HQ494_09560, partial [Rhodospirillales bacterium]|nr:hypothetical protein [Rhodospirillales bacterium]